MVLYVLSVYVTQESMHILFETNALGVHDGCVAQILCTKGTARLITFSIPTTNFGVSYALEP